MKTSAWISNIVCIFGTFLITHSSAQNEGTHFSRGCKPDVFTITYGRNGTHFNFTLESINSLLKYPDFRDNFQISSILTIITPLRNKNTWEFVISRKNNSVWIQLEKPGEYDKMLKGIEEGVRTACAAPISLNFVLEKNMDPDFTDKVTGYNPLQMTAWLGTVGEGEDLIRRGADVNKKYEGIPPPLHLAIFNYDFVKMLLDRGAKVDLRSDDSENPLHVAAEYGLTRIIELLLKRKPMLDWRNKRGETPLMKAVKFGHFDAAKTLLSAGADPHIPETRGKTAIDYAKELGKKNIIELFEPSKQ